MRLFWVLLAALAIAAPARASPPLEAYGQLPAISAVALSPSGDRFAVAAADPKGGWNVIVRTSTGAPVAGQSFKTAKIWRLDFADEDHLMIFESAPLKRTIETSYPGIPNFPRTDFVALNLKTHASFRLLSDATAGLEPVVGRWGGTRVIGGHVYAFVGAYPKGQMGSFKEGAHFPDLYRIDLDTGRPERVAASGQRPRAWLIGADGQVLANTLYDPDHQQWTVFSGAEPDHPILQRKGTDYLELVGLGRTPGTILVSERVDEATSLREVRIDGQGDGVVLAAGEAATDPFADRDTLLTVGLSTVRTQTLFDPLQQKRIDDAQKVFPDDRTRLYAHSRNFDRMILLSEGPKNSGRFWFFDAMARSAAPLGDLRPAVTPQDVGPMRMFAYKAADGLALDGVLTLPPGREPKGLPVVVMPHGGPIVGADQPGFDWWAQAFASRGYAVFQPNYRGTLGYGDTLRKAANGEFGKKMLSDLSDGVAALAQAGIVDPKRACIVGASYGGYAALASVTLQHGRYRCAVSVAGIADVDQLLFWTRAHYNLSGRLIGERQWKTLTGLEPGAMGAVSPAHAAASADAPVLLVHGDDDLTVPAEQSHIMERALSSAGKPVTFVSLGVADHAMSDAPARQAMLAASVAFVEKNNPAN